MTERVKEALTTKRATFPATSSDSSQFAVPSPLRSYVLTRHKKRTVKTDQRSSAASGPVSSTARAQGDADEEDSDDIASRRAGNDLWRSHVCSWKKTESEQKRIGQLQRAGGGGPLYMSGQGAHIHQQQLRQGALKETVWTPNADLYYGKGIKAAHIKTKAKPGASLGKSAQAADATPTIPG